jgi:hypothetical protein
MELVFFLIILVIEAILIYWLLGNFYSLFRKPSVYFPFFLAVKMGFVTLLGAPLLGIGGTLLAIFVFDYEFRKRSDYKSLYVILAGSIIAMITTVILYFSFMFLAWDVFG